MLKDLFEEIDPETYPVRDVASATVKTCLNTVPGEPTIRDALFELGWNEIRKSDRQERHIRALATIYFNDHIDYSNYFLTTENIWKAGWDRALQYASQQARRPNVRNSLRQTMWFEIESSDAFLAVETDKSDFFPSTDCNIAVTTDVGENSIAARFQDLNMQDFPPVLAAPVQWFMNGQTNNSVQMYSFDATAIEDNILDEFGFIGHISVNHYLNTRVPQ